LDFERCSSTSSFRRTRRRFDYGNSSGSKSSVRCRTPFAIARRVTSTRTSCFARSATA